MEALQGQHATKRKFEMILKKRDEMCSGAKSSPPQVCPGMEGWGQEEKKSCRLRPSPNLSATSTLSPPPPPGPEGEGLAILLRPSPTATHKNVAWSVTYGPRSSPLPLRDRTAVGRSVGGERLSHPRRGKGCSAQARPLFCPRPRSDSAAGLQRAVQLQQKGEIQQ